MKLNILFLTLDDRMVLEFIGYSLEELLENTAIGIHEARYEEDAIHILEFENIDLIIADMNINTLESYEFYDLLQENKKFSYIPFVFLSANEEDQEIAILKGISNFFLKPLDVDQLMSTLHEILKQSQTPQNESNFADIYTLDDDISISEDEKHVENIKTYINQIETLIEKYENKDEIKDLTTLVKYEINKLSN